MQYKTDVQCIYREVALTEITTIGQDSKFDFRQWKEIFLSSTASWTDLRPTRAPVYWVLGALSPGVKWLGRKAGPFIST
jgi:hypothetical protein